MTAYFPPGERQLADRKIIERTTSDLNRLALRRPYLVAGGLPFIALLNWFTGVGKTHGMAIFALELFSKAEAIPVFIAPLRSLVTAFSDRMQIETKSEIIDELHKNIAALNSEIPVYHLLSVDYHCSDTTFFSACIDLVRWLRSQPEVLDMLVGSGRGSAESDAELRNDLAMLASKAELSSKGRAAVLPVGTISLEAEFLFRDRDEEFKRIAEEAHALANALVRKLIKVFADSVRRGSASPSLFGADGPRHARASAFVEMVRRLYPLQLFIERPGVIVTTAAKSRSQQEYFACDGGKLKWIKHATLHEMLGEMNDGATVIGRAASARPGRPAHDRGAQAVLFVDEEEESYWHLHERRESTINKDGRLDLNLVITEFLDYFDSTWPIGIAHRGQPWMARDLYENLERFAEISPLLEERRRLEMASRDGLRRLGAQRSFELFRELLSSRHPDLAARYGDDDLKVVWKQLHLDAGDAHSKFERLAEKARVHVGMRKLFEAIRPEGLSGFETYKAFLDLVHHKKFFLMNRCAYGEVLDQPNQTFFTGRGEVMSSSFLGRVQLCHAAGEQTVRLEYHDSAAPHGSITLLHYLRVVMYIAATLHDPQNPISITAAKSDAQALYRRLRAFKAQTSKAFNKRVSEAAIGSDFDSEQLIQESFFYEEIKNVVSLEESRHQAEEYNRDVDICLTVSVHSLDRTPEDDILKALGARNGVYLASATGGLKCASSGAFNLKRLQLLLERVGGRLFETDAEQLDVLKGRAEANLAARARRCTVFDEHDAGVDLGCSPGYPKLREYLSLAMPVDEDGDPIIYNVHKRNEIAALAASLDRLITSPARSGLVLCQTPRNARETLHRIGLGAAQPGWRNESAVRILDLDAGPNRAGHLFEINAARIPAYRQMGIATKVVVAIYTADRFRKAPKGRVGDLDIDDELPFSDDLIEALDISGGKKALIWSAYQSASRGINFMTRENGEERDFELFALVNDPFYTKHTRTGTRGFVMKTFQAFLQVLRDRGDAWKAMSYRQLLALFNRSQWAVLAREHYIDITRTLFQAIGRSERRAGVPMERGQELWIGRSAVRSLHLGLRDMGEMRARASAAQRVVIGAVEDHNRQSLLFPTPDSRIRHCTDSLMRCAALRDFTDRIPRKMRSDAASRRLWGQLFRQEMFNKPSSYLETLKASGVIEDFWGGAFLKVPQGVDLYLRTVRRNGFEAQVITDNVDGESPYEWSTMLAPLGMMNEFVPEVRRLVNAMRQGSPCDADADADGRPMRLVPQPWFVVEILKGYLGELVFESYLQANIDPSIFAAAPITGRATPLSVLDLSQDPHEEALYQLFDYYLEHSNGALIAVDVKNWSRIADTLNSDELRARAKEKFDRLRRLYPARRIRCLYVNLHGADKESSMEMDNGDIRFSSMFVVLQPRGMRPWQANQRLAELLMLER